MLSALTRSSTRGKKTRPLFRMQMEAYLVTTYQITGRSGDQNLNQMKGKKRKDQENDEKWRKTLKKEAAHTKK